MLRILQDKVLLGKIGNIWVKYFKILYLFRHILQVVHIAERNQKRGVKEKSVNREKHEKDKMTEDSNTHGSEES
jgi:hypothetical protein